MLTGSSRNGGQEPAPSNHLLKPLSKFVVYAAGNRYSYYMGLFVRLLTLSCLLVSVSVVLYWSFFAAGTTQWYRLGDVPASLFRSGEDSSASATNISHLLFGIGGSLQTWHDRRRYASLWWDPNATRGYAWLDGKPAAEDDNDPVPCRVSEDWSRFKFVNPLSAARMARIVVESFRLGLPNVRWFVMGDDDTVFFSENLVTVLARYDHHQMYYVGSSSESVEQNVMHSYEMAFGGGGFAISYALAAYLVRELDGCLDRYGNLYGSDQRVFACISEIGVALTRHGGFHQFDIRGDPYGILAAHPLAPLISLHHLDAVSPIFPNQTRLDSAKSLVQAYHIDPSRSLQQSFCYDPKRKWSISISWGYTIRLYPYFVSPMDLQTPLQTFKTWRSWSNGPFTFNTRPVSSDPCEQPVTYFLEKAEGVGKTGTMTSYRRVVQNSEKACDRAEYVGANQLQAITVSTKKLRLEYWQGPRRQCCELQDHGRIKNGRMKIRIRKCRPRETVTS